MDAVVDALWWVAAIVLTVGTCLIVAGAGVFEAGRWIVLGGLYGAAVLATADKDYPLAVLLVVIALMCFPLLANPAGWGR